MVNVEKKKEEEMRRDGIIKENHAVGIRKCHELKCTNQVVCWLSGHSPNFKKFLFVERVM